MAEFVYNNAKNAGISHTPFELNFSYYPQMLYKEDVNPLPVQVGRRAISGTQRAEDCLLGKAPLYPKTSKTSLQ